jgi:rare lipoprotein A
MPMVAACSPRESWRSPRSGAEVLCSPTDEHGKASYYSDRLTGRRTASGDRYDPRALTAAHRTLRFGTVVEVVRLASGARVRVRVNDRGPFKAGRVIDLSSRAADVLGMKRAGVVDVCVHALP